MKKHLVLGSALLAAISAFPQSPGNRAVLSGVENSAQKFAHKFANMSKADESAQSANYISGPAVNPVEEPVAQTSNRSNSVSSFTTTWNPFTGSMNIYGVLVNSSKPLQYNDELNAVTFIHRKSNTYSFTPVPTSTTAASGAIVAMVSANFGNNWDSTLLWSNNTLWARYPQGGIYNPPGNTNISNAYVVATGPITTNASVWTGNFFASKQLGTANYNNVASTATGAQQFIANTQPFSGLDKTDFARLNFASPDNGAVYALGTIAKDVNATSTALTFGYRGARVVKGTFTSGTFAWSGDSIIPSVSTAPSDGSKNLLSTPYMAWNEAGTVGYVFHIGVASGATGNNRGFQPIVVKTTNGGVSWAPVTGIDFNLPAFQAPVLDHILSAKINTTATIPFFNISEGIGAIVDKDDNLHIVASLVGTSSDDPDSLGYTFRFNNSDGETYKYPHSPGLRPYIYDFIGGGANPWKVVVVDSMSSEVPGESTADAGFATNPWDATGPVGSEKVSSDARIQLSRTADGKYIVYTWAESDTLVTLKKWNSLPNVKARLMDVSAGTIHPTELNVTRPNISNQRNPRVDSRAYFHYTSPLCALAQTIAVGANGPAIALPMTVSNNPGLNQMLAITHRYASTVLNFGNLADADVLNPGNITTGDTTGINENSLSSVKGSYVYPNPAKNNAVLVIDLKDNSKVEVSVMNLMGQVVKTSNTDAQIGQNNINIDLNGLSKGVYMATVKVNSTSSTKKLIVE